MTVTTPHILLIEDNSGDARYIRELPREAREFSQRVVERESGFVREQGEPDGSDSTLTHETRLEEGLASLEKGLHDVVLLDLNLPDSKGIETLASVVDHDSTVPVVVLTGLRAREVGVEALREGAEEYLVKDEINPDQLVRSIHHAIERKAHEREQKRYETLIEESADANAIIDPDGTINYLTPSVEYALGYSADELIGKSCFEYIHPGDREAVTQEFSVMLEDADYRASTDFRFRHADGSWIVLHARGRNLLDDPVIEGLVVYTHDITERKEYERQLERQHERLGALNQLNGVVHGITEAAIGQSTREEIEAVACSRLADSASYAFAWVGQPDSATGTLGVNASANADDYLEDVTSAADTNVREDGSDSDGGEYWTLVTESVESGEVRTTVEPEGSNRRYRSAAAIPITHQDTVYGVLNVYTERADAFQDEEGEVIGHLGEILGHAIAAAERKQALMSESVVELEFRIEDVFEAFGVETTPDDEITIEQTITASDEEFLVYGTASADSVATLEEMSAAIDHWEDVAVISEGLEETRFQLRLSRPPLMSEIASLGGSVEELVIEDDERRLTVHLPEDVEVRTVIGTVQDRYPQAEAVARRQLIQQDTSSQRLQEVWTTELTDRQRTVLETAYFAGYFEWPRDTSGEAVADSLDISAATFSQHLRAAQNKVFDSLLEGEGIERTEGS